MAFNEKTDKRLIIVSATALAASGALTILKQFIRHAANDINNYVMFVPAGLNLPMHGNIQYIFNAPKGWVGRIYWDWFGCRKAINKLNNNIKKIICLQNSTLNVDFEQVVYLHQPIPFSEYNNFLSNLSLNNLKLFLYKKVYAYFIFKFCNERTVFVVQTEWMKIGVLKKCPKLKKEQVIVIKPDVKGFNISDSFHKNSIRKNTILYPATPLSYKNHLVILDALGVLKNKIELNDICFQVTFNKGEYKNFDNYVAKNKLESHIEYLGVLTHDLLKVKYQEATAIVYPSYIESYGLPLIEAASLGKRIICSDLPYSRDVLAQYNGAVYVKYNHVNGWVDELANSMLSPSEHYFKPFENDSRSSWEHFFKLL
ncbi:glycosyltransferase [Buttiauxella gaviniae]|uniref:glycosyltransferase n=1 Tax=Buttiauxella gaviniae TaxID=82990 RepID=UPI003BB805A6